VSVHTACPALLIVNFVSLLVLPDISAAFDTVDHDILPDVLSHRFNITDTAFRQLVPVMSAMSVRTQTVVYHEQQTDIIEIGCSVPQRLYDGSGSQHFALPHFRRYQIAPL